MIYLKSEIEIRPGHVPAMLELLTGTLFPILQERGGWKMLGCFVQRTGQLNTIIDLWELEDYNHYERGMGCVREASNYPDIRKSIDSHVEKERLVFMQRHF